MKFKEFFWFELLGRCPVCHHKVEKYRYKYSFDLSCYVDSWHCPKCKWGE